ncbi:metallophosphoesterase [Neobacillus dielmonensis]|uniref:metallophosphoesterase n=1 Tax=Neobacillus dielmonensis TaxID=1347369 RepID=UPI000694CB32|nr:metallophosphoesterase [Neobacillus dielmonensis]
MFSKLIWLNILTLTLALQTSASQVFAAETALNEVLVDLRVLETTDIHADLVNYDYYQNRINNRVGLVKTASLIRKARKEASNSLLFDNGDHLKGNPLGEYLARIKGIHKGMIHPVYRAFNYLNYDAIAIGNHEFNYGLKFLKAALQGAEMPVLNANVYSIKHNVPYFTPYVILKRNVIDQNGVKHELKIGVISFMPVQIMRWDKSNLEGRVYAKPIVETAKTFIPLIKAEGADIIIALAHTGISSDPYRPDTENAVYYLTKIPGIDAILAGHSHSIFPGPSYQNLPHTNLKKGQINRIPVVMAGAFGNRLGIIDLKLKKQKEGWKVLDGTSMTRAIATEKGKSLVKRHEGLYEVVKPEHLETLRLIKKLGW